MATVLAIRLGALGDMVVAVRAFRALRDHHAGDTLMLLTTPPFEGFAAATGLFDRILLLHKRPAGTRLAGWWRLVRTLRALRLARVYDLQQNDRTAMLFQALRPGRGDAGRLDWSGTARGCTLPVDNRAPHRCRAHAYERHEDQLRVAGVTRFPGIDLDFLAGTGPAGFDLTPPYALLVPGASPQRPDKRWPADRYGALAVAIAAAGITPVALGGGAEADAIAVMAAGCPSLIDLGGRTRVEDLAALGRSAAFAVGNDTGPMHVIAPSGCRSLVLYSAASDPRRTAPLGPDFQPVPVQQVPDLDGLAVGDVIGRLRRLGCL